MKKRILRCVGGGLLLLAPVLLWSWQPYGLRTPVNALWWQLLMGALLASGLLVLRVIDLAALGSFAEALLAPCCCCSAGSGRVPALPCPTGTTPAGSPRC